MSLKHLLLPFLVIVVMLPKAAPAQDEITFATHAEGSAYYKIATSMTAILAESFGREGVITPFKRWTKYLPVIDRGEIDVGFVTGIDAGTRFRDESERGLPNLRAIARLWVVRYTYIGRAAFGMKNYVGFRGRRIGLVVRNNRTMTELNRALLRTVALSDRDVKGVDLRNFSDGIDKLSRGEIDAAPIIVGVPIIRKARAKVPLGLNYVGLFGPRATTKFLAEQVPGLYVTDVQPSKRLPEAREPVLVAGFDAFLITHADASDDTVATIARLFHENHAVLAKQHALLRTLADDAISAPTNPIPYHPAAIAYYKDRGLWTSANDDAEARLRE